MVLCAGLLLDDKLFIAVFVEGYNWGGLCEILCRSVVMMCSMVGWAYW